MGELFYARDIYGKTLAELGKKDKNLVVLDADLSGSTRTSLFAKEFPDRFFNFGVAEQNMMASAAGLASCGKTVFVSTFAMFATARVLDQVRNTITYNHFNVKIVATHAGITVGEDGSSHQALEDVAFLRALPNMNVIVPADPVEVKEVIEYVYKTPGPFYVRLGRAKTEVLDKKPNFSFNKAQVLREGKDVAIIACGIMVKEALLAYEKLKEKNITAYVINISTIKPIDKDFISSLSSKVKGMVVCEEHSIIGGLGSAVSEVVCETKPCRIERVGTKDKFGQSGDPKDLLKEYGLTSEDIVLAVQRILR